MSESLSLTMRRWFFEPVSARLKTIEGGLKDMSANLDQSITDLKKAQADNRKAISQEFTQVTTAIDDLKKQIDDLKAQGSPVTSAQLAEIAAVVQSLQDDAKAVSAIVADTTTPPAK